MRSSSKNKNIVFESENQERIINKRGDKFIVSVPFGKPKEQRNIRIYNRDGLLELIPDIENERFFLKPKLWHG